MYHVTQLKAFHFNPLKTSQVDVARKDYLELFLDRVQFDRTFDKVTLPVAKITATNMQGIFQVGNLGGFEEHNVRKMNTSNEHQKVSSEKKAGPEVMRQI